MVRSPQVFTLEAINAMVPRLNELVGLQLERRGTIERKLKDLSTLTGEVPEAIVLDPADPAPVAQLKNELATAIEQYQGAWRELESLGAVLKDARLGLLDFFGDVEGQRVWLCWKYGEHEVTHYHALDEGYAARKELSHGMKHRLLN